MKYRKSEELRGNAGMQLVSLKPEELIGKLDLRGNGLEKARQAAAAGNRMETMKSLLEYYREKYPIPVDIPPQAEMDLAQADKICRHIFKYLQYDEVAYGDNIDWEWDPRGDIEWVAAMYRFYWAVPLAEAFAATRDEKYARAFVELATDWIAKHRLENYEKVHPVYKYWTGFAWRELQTGWRSKSICSAFLKLVHARTFTPEFLERLMASLYDHQVKTLLLPVDVSNGVFWEQEGFIDVCTTFREFSGTQAWMEKAVNRSREFLLSDISGDGVHREWAFSYHCGMTATAVAIKKRIQAFGMTVPEDYCERVRLMHDYIFWMATPELGWPMFGDADRPLKKTDDRSKWQLYGLLMAATEFLGDKKYAALARMNRQQLPEHKSKAFKEAGMYVMRNDWGDDQIYLGLHCSPPAAPTSHDHPDNGMFEMYAYGRWLMPNTGYYTYGHNPAGRAWHRQTRVHQTLTVDGKDASVYGRHLLWASEGCNSDILTVENKSYEGLTHRRTVWFVNRQYFVLLDEAIGAISGKLYLHFHFAPGDVVFQGKRAYTLFNDANVLVQAADNSPVTITEEEGWFAWEYGCRLPRKAMRFEHADAAPAVFLTVVAPYRGTVVPEISCVLPDGFAAGDDRVELKVLAFGETWTLARALANGEAWCKK